MNAAQADPAGYLVFKGNTGLWQVELFEQEGHELPLVSDRFVADTYEAANHKRTNTERQSGPNVKT
uniref:hypothetical protein n=1 Tax=Pseudomonas sp. RW407 TaxID=2202894 RepID=UPI0011B77F5F|nr:hypothetical protein [Pseudomonas sp. RW407]